MESYKFWKRAGDLNKLIINQKKLKWNQRGIVWNLDLMTEAFDVSEKVLSKWNQRGIVWNLDLMTETFDVSEKVLSSRSNEPKARCQ